MEHKRLTTNGKTLLNSIDGEKEFNQIFEIIERRQKIISTWKFNN